MLFFHLTDAGTQRPLEYSYSLEPEGSEYRTVTARLQGHHDAQRTGKKILGVFTCFLDPGLEEVLTEMAGRRGRDVYRWLVAIFAHGMTTGFGVPLPVADEDGLIGRVVDEAMMLQPELHTLLNEDERMADIYVRVALQAIAYALKERENPGYGGKRRKRRRK